VPYGTTVIRGNHGKLRAGNILISNFNNRANLQGTGTTIVQLDPATAAGPPRGLAMAPNGDILAVNGNNGKIVEVKPGGQQVATATLDSHGKPAGAGALFGLALVPGNGGVFYVDDAVNTLRLLH
jgi:hypothetical protein